MRSAFSCAGTYRKTEVVFDLSAWPRASPIRCQPNATEVGIFIGNCLRLRARSVDIFVLGDCPRASGNSGVHDADTTPRFARGEEFLTQSRGRCVKFFPVPYLSCAPFFASTE